MKIAFDQIKALLDDPFFEIQCVGKEAVRQRIMPVDKYSKAPVNFQFIEWTEEDAKGVIEYSFLNSGIGRLLLANTAKGLCFLGFASKGEAEIKADFMRRFPKQPMTEKVSGFQLQAVEYCNGNHERLIPLHLRGTDFQIGIWKQLVRIPEGRLSTYGSLAPHAGGAQAVGSAVGANPVSYIVPCHRIVKSDGNIQGYHWGTEIKKQLLAYEFHAYERKK
ncbi:MAG: methylated-DNA--[protein]-cysteine S-methyltransferase [Bacteroidales bacterium]|nr:methylated-DNA--[protein]-cysteine S-methyltransferase [Bacteroidales bacterium]